MVSKDKPFCLVGVVSLEELNSFEGKSEKTTKMLHGEAWNYDDITEGVSLCRLFCLLVSLCPVFRGISTSKGAPERPLYSSRE